jgi:hypothetical protein
MPEVQVAPGTLISALDPATLMWPPGGTATALPTPVKTPAGWLPVRQLEDADVYMYAGPTGRSAYWPEWFSFVHPDCATTDTALNLVDEIWFGDPQQEVELVVFFQDLPVTALSETVEEIRNMLDLPAAQIAAMCGVSRRQFYNLLNGQSTSFGREQWIRSLYEAINRLYRAVGGDGDKLRAAVLSPVEGGDSVLRAASANDTRALNSIVEAMQQRILAGFQGRVRRPVPLKKGGRTSDEGADFLGDYRERGS